MRLDKDSPKLKLEYPCQWIYKLIGSNKESIQEAIAEIIVGKEYKIELSNKSSAGKYCCMNLEMSTESEEERTATYASLKSHPNIIMVL